MERTKTRKFIAEKIRSQYVPDVVSKNSFDNLSKLQQLDKRVKSIPVLWCVIFGSLECLGFLSNMFVVTAVLLTGNFFNKLPEDLITPILIGCIVGAILDLILMILNYPIYKRWYRLRHTHYADQIIILSDAVLGEVDFIVDLALEKGPSSAEIAMLANLQQQSEEEFME